MQVKKKFIEIIKSLRDNHEVVLNTAFQNRSAVKNKHSKNSVSMVRFIG